MCSDQPLQLRRAYALRQKFLEIIHDQLPLAVPCYDFVLVTELTVGRDKRERRVLPASLT